MLYHFKDISEKAIEGHTDPLIAYAELKAYKMELEQAIKDLEPLAIEESEKYGKSFELHGIKFERRNGATRYDFKHIEEWQNMNTEIKNFEKRCKQALSSSKYGGSCIDANGEEMPLPKVNYSKDSLIIK